MDVRLVNPFILAVKNVFSTMVGTEVLISKPHITMGERPRVDVSAIIGFSGDAVGSVALNFPIKTAVNAASKFAGIDITPQHPDFADALGELANMVAGQAKSKIEGVSASISLPRVVVGADIQVLESKKTPILTLPCDSPLGRFNIEATMVLTGGKRPRAQTAGAQA